MKRLQLLFGSILLAISAVAQWSSMSFSASGFAQIVIPFKQEKEFRYDWSKSDNSLVLTFPTASPAELEPINNYDERLIRRVLIKDLGPSGTEVRLVLKDQSVKALVSSFKDPFRVSVDLFDKNYVQKKDPITGLPIDSDDSEGLEAPISSANPELFSASPVQTTPNSVPKNSDGDASNASKRRLMQPLPAELSSAHELKAALANVDAGLGKGWAEYPPYIYRAQLAPYEGREAPDKELAAYRNKALTGSGSMAELASKLYDFGHESRALLAYQQVLLKDPSVFEKDPVHLWKFAESHLGHGNFMLAEGYYTSLIDKHATHPLARLARLRKIDVTAIKSLKSKDTKSLPSLAQMMDSIKQGASQEVQAMALIRKAWWQDDPNASHDRTAMPPLATEDTQRQLEKLVGNVESQRTAYLASAIIAKRMTRLETPWEPSYATWLNEFFGKYKGPSSEPVRGKLVDDAKVRLSAEIKDVFKKSAYVDLVALFEALPTPMKSISKDPDVAWAVAESYRSLGQGEKAIPFMEAAAATEIGPDRFKAQFWLTSLSGNLAQDFRKKKGDQAKIRKYSNLAKKSDEALLATWSKLKNDEKSLLHTSMGAALEEEVASSLLTKAPAKILLEKWTATLTANPPKISASNGNNPTDIEGNSSPSKSTVRLLDDLGRKFAELGLQTERRQAMQLMKFIQPASIESDKAAQKVWTEQLLKLAEERRSANDYLEAGELYTLVGEHGDASENRAEANYKGGLLLFRAGKKQEAIKALEKAKSDPNNLFYSKLATERLDQLQAH
jgi:hypothetical protein